MTHNHQFHVKRVNSKSNINSCVIIAICIVFRINKNTGSSHEEVNNQFFISKIVVKMPQVMLTQTLANSTCPNQDSKELMSGHLVVDKTIVYILIYMLDHLDGLNKSFTSIMSLKISGLPVTFRAWAEIASEHRLDSFTL